MINNIVGAVFQDRVTCKCSLAGLLIVLLFEFKSIDNFMIEFLEFFLLEEKIYNKSIKQDWKSGQSKFYFKYSNCEKI